MKCPSCNSENNIFRDRRPEDPWYCYTCKTCGKRLRLDGRHRLLSSFIILSIGLGVATFLEHTPIVAVVVALATIVFVAWRTFEL